MQETANKQKRINLKTLHEMLNGMSVELAEKVHLLFMANYIDYSDYEFRDENQVENYSLMVNVANIIWVKPSKAEEGTIIYVGMQFPGYSMDIEYEKYVPKEYLPEGLDLSKDNPTRQKAIQR